MSKQEIAVERLTRYDPADVSNNPYRHKVGMEPRSDGEWVHYDDVRLLLDAATAELRAENEQLKSDLARIKSLCRTAKKLDMGRDALTVIAGYCAEDEPTNHPERGV